MHDCLWCRETKKRKKCRITLAATSPSCPSVPPRCPPPRSQRSRFISTAVAFDEAATNEFGKYLSVSLAPIKTHTHSLVPLTRRPRCDNKELAVGHEGQKIKAASQFRCSTDGVFFLFLFFAFFFLKYTAYCWRSLFGST